MTAATNDRVLSQVRWSGLGGGALSAPMPHTRHVSSASADGFTVPSAATANATDPCLRRHARKVASAWSRSDMKRMTMAALARRGTVVSMVYAMASPSHTDGAVAAEPRSPGLVLGPYVPLPATASASVAVPCVWPPRAPPLPPPLPPDAGAWASWALWYSDTA